MYAGNCAAVQFKYLFASVSARRFFKIPMHEINVAGACSPTSSASPIHHVERNVASFFDIRTTKQAPYSPRSHTYTIPTHKNQHTERDGCYPSHTHGPKFEHGGSLVDTGQRVGTDGSMVDPAHSKCT